MSEERYTRMKKSMKRVRKKTISGENVFVYRKARTGAAVCNHCGRELHGVPKLFKSQLGKLSISEKRPNRKFGGYYCADCTREFFKDMARGV